MATTQVQVNPDTEAAPRNPERKPDPCIVVIFGASGDLTKRKLLPALYHLQQAKLLPENFSVVGVARRDLGDEFKKEMREGFVKFGGVDTGEAKLDDFIQKLDYQSLEFDDANG